MVQLVNGYACRNPADAALARRGVDPAPPQRTVAAPATAAGTQPAAATESRKPDAAAPHRGQLVNLIA